MSDLHTLPLLTHDLPEYVLTAPEPDKAKVKVFKQGLYWTWEHACSYRPKSTPANGYPYASQETALNWALNHHKRCL